MPFIRFRKLVYDDSGQLVSGTAAIVDVKYVPGEAKYHSKQIVREKLGKVIEKHSNKKGLFQSPTRGLVIYDSSTDSFSSQLSKNEVKRKIENKETVNKIFKNDLVHTVFGDVYLLLEFIKQIGLLKILSESFQNKIFLERLLVHIAHGILKDSAKISCDDFALKSFISYFIEDIPLNSLKSDTFYFTEMSSDEIKIKFFTKYVEYMRTIYPDFGDACYVDSTPLPNDIDSPFNALRSHGLDGASVQMRLVLIIDQKTTYPLWFDIIPGNVLDVNTLKVKARDVEISIGIKINGYVLDAGYVSRELIQDFPLQQENESKPVRNYLARMPARKGYPYRSLYTRIKPLLKNAKYYFIRKRHSYFGKAIKQKIFDTDVMCYVYVDDYNAMNGYVKFVTDHNDEYEKLTFREKTWRMSKDGFFILLSNYIKSPQEILDDYFSRVKVEKSFKTSKEYLKLLPLCKWTDTTVRGKIFSDIIELIIRQKMEEISKASIFSISEIIGKCQSLMCAFDKNNNTIVVETPNKQVKECYQQFGVEIPRELDRSAYMEGLYPSS